MFEHVSHHLQHYTEERRNGQTRGLSCSNLISSRQPVRAKSSATMEDELKELCESLSSSASNSQHSLTVLPSSAFPASPPQESPVVPRQPNKRVRASAHLHPHLLPHFHPCFFPSPRLTCCLFLLLPALRSGYTGFFSTLPLWSLYDRLHECMCNTAALLKCHSRIVILLAALNCGDFYKIYCDIIFIT